jgi:putative intracellular protease/amidase
MKRYILIALLLACISTFAYSQTTEGTAITSESFSLETLSVTSVSQETSPGPGYVLFIIPQYNFVDDEYSIPKVVLSRAGYTIETASISTRELALGADIIKVRPKLTIEQIDISRYKAVIFVGGYLSKKFFENKALIEKAIAFNERGTLIGAMDNAPYFLAQWGIVGEARVTVNKSLAKTMKSMGVNYSEKNIVVDRNLVTVDSFMYSDAFAAEFLLALDKIK